MYNILSQLLHLLGARTNLAANKDYYFLCFKCAKQSFSSPGMCYERAIISSPIDWKNVFSVKKTLESHCSALHVQNEVVLVPDVRRLHQN